MNNMKTSCMGIHQDSTEPSVLGSIRKIFQSTCVEYPVETKDIDFYKIQRNYQKLANKQFLISPKTPADVQDEVTLKKFGYTKHTGDDASTFFKICCDAKDFAYCLFCSDKIIYLMKENIPSNVERKILVDATFSVLPIGSFKQLLIIHIEYFETVFPAIFVLMNKKTKKSYEHVVNYINTNVVKLDGAVFMADFEIGLRSAIKKIFEYSKLFGCWFHYCQAVRRNIATKHKNLAEFIRQNRKASISYHKILSLPLLPETHIVNCFSIIKEEIATFDHLFKFESFLKYFEEQWLKKVSCFKSQK
nr:uncharacterized protein LOC118682123 [Bactrocera oleae]